MITRILLILLILSGIAHAQPDSLWSYTYGGMHRDCGYSVIQTNDGGFAVAGVYKHGSNYNTKDAYLVKTDANGEVEWEQTYDAGGDEARQEGAREVIQTSDGGYLLAGQTYSNDDTGPDCWAVKTDSAGEVEWANSYGGDDSEEFYDVVETVDGCYLLLGHTTSFGAGAYDIYLVKTNADGEEIWSRTYGGELREYGTGIISTDDSCYVFCGCTYSFGNGSKDYYIVKVDVDGEVVWSNTFGTEFFETCYGVVQTLDGGYGLTGLQREGEGGGLYFTRTDSESDELWSQTYENRYGEWGTDVILTEDGDFVITSFGNFRESHGIDAYLLHIEPDEGDIVWSTIFGTRQSEYPWSLIQTADGGYAMAGYISDSNEEGQNLNCVWLLKTGMDMVQWKPLPDTTMYGHDTLIYDLSYFRDYVTPSVSPDSLLGFNVRSGVHAYGEIVDNRLIITAIKDEYGLDRQFRLIAFERHDESNCDTTFLHITILEDSSDIVDTPEPDIPLEFALYDIYPNPFNSTTTITYGLGAPCPTRLALYDLSGRMGVTLLDDDVSAGNHSLTWDAKDYPAGVYFVKMTCNDKSMMQKIVLIK